MDIREITAGTDTPTSTDNNKVLIGNLTAGIAMTLDTDANQTWTQGDAFALLALDGDITVTPASGVTVDGAEEAFVVYEGQQILLINTDGADAWQRDGDRMRDIEETGASVTLDPKHMNAALRAAGTAAQTITVNTSTGKVTDWVEIICDNPAGVTITAGTATFSPSGDVVLSYGQSAHILQRAAGVWQMSAPAPVISSAEATSTTPKVTTGEWSPYRVRESVRSHAGRGLPNVSEYTSKTVTSAAMSVWPNARGNGQGDSFALAAGYLYAFGPIPKFWDFNVTDVSMHVAAAATGTGEVDFALASVGADGLPDGVVTDTVTIDVSSVGAVSVSSLNLDTAEDFVYVLLWANNGNTSTMDFEGVLVNIQPLFTQQSTSADHQVLRADVGAAGIPANFDSVTSITGGGAGSTTDWGTVDGGVYVPALWIGG